MGTHPPDVDMFSAKNNTQTWLAIQYIYLVLGKRRQPTRIWSSAPLPLGTELQWPGLPSVQTDGHRCPTGALGRTHPQHSLLIKLSAPVVHPHMLLEAVRPSCTVGVATPGPSHCTHIRHLGIRQQQTETLQQCS